MAEAVALRARPRSGRARRRRRSCDRRSSETTPRFGDERRERIVGDLRARRGDARNQRGLAGVGESDQADVGEQLQLETQEPLFALLRRARSAAARGWWTRRTGRCRGRRGRPSRRARAGRPRRGRRAASARLPLGSFSKTSVPIGTSISRSSAVWPVLFEPCPCWPRLRLELGVEAEVDERVLRGSGDDVDRAAVAAVAAVRAAARDELLAAEAQAAAAAVAGGDVDVDFVDEHLDQYRRLNRDCRLRAGGTRGP